ncbi:preprotein translocase subunit SecE [bacterium]|nr:preprotein translocase subunit SecE [bacterium]
MAQILDKIKTFFKEVISQAKKIDWPTRGEAFKYTLIVIGISVSVAIFLGSLDYIFIRILEKFTLSG